jgi:hypothetical protein
MHFGSAGPGQQALLQQLDLGPFLRAALADALLRLTIQAADAGPGPGLPQVTPASLAGPMVVMPRHMVGGRCGSACRHPARRLHLRPPIPGA